MSIEANKALIRRFFDAINTGQGSAIVDLIFAPQFSVNGNPMKPDDFRELFTWALTGVPDWHQEVEDLIAEGDKVVARLSVFGTPRERWRRFPTNGESFTSTGIFIFRIVDGRVVEAWDNFDVLREFVTLGIVELPKLS